MEIELKYPQNELLKKYISCYYGSKIDNDNYIAFPNHYFPTCIIKNASFTSDDYQVCIKKEPSKGLSFFGTNIYKKPVEINFEGKFEAFNIIFEPYGLAQFTDKGINFKNNFSLDFTSLLQPFFTEHPSFDSYSLQEKISTIEVYLLFVINIKNHTDAVKSKIDDLVINGITEQPLAQEISDKTFYRAFKNICGESPGTIYNIIRLRKAMDYIGHRTESERLTDITYALDFFDQAHFTNFFKKLTQKSPKNFPVNLTYLPNEMNESIFFEFIKNV
ncbi:helix-turn-helix domain-containing protein [Flavobacterium rhizosphaerae]|uniref:Helix-turn-helix domain-containing protein n=1 Tax=Flavobacterium rhizosphaerae TaxID=3163298 RepID=A0ABW8YTC6_9FLAO